jgi:class 3 adenylate cyclase/predicted ATPase
MIYVFGEYELDTDCHELRRAGTPLQVEPKAFALLAYLVQQGGRIIAKDELFEQLWPNQFVSDDALVYCIVAARKAIGDSGRVQRFIKTVHARGYRFIAPVEERPHTSFTHPQPASATDGRPVVPEGGVSAAERRQLTVLCCRVVASPLHAEHLDPEDLGVVVQNAQAVCTEVIHRLAGYIVQSLGDGLLAYFGYPQAHEDDARRAVQTGLRIVQAIEQLGRRFGRERAVRLVVRLGIHTGGVVVGTPGEGAGHEPLTLGETPNLAIQLQGLAGPNTVVISQATWTLVEGYVVCRSLGAFLLEEQTQPQPLVAYQVLQETTAQSRFEVAVSRGLTPFVGRQQEVNLLLERWEQVREGRGQVVLLSGEAGIGKSRLIHVLNERLAGQPQVRLESRGSPYHQHSALQPVIAHLQELLQWRWEETPEEKLQRLETALEPYGLTLTEVVPLFAALLSVPLAGRYASLSLTPQRQKQKTLEALLAWLLRETERQPVRFVMEDLHWVDPSTLEWLGLLIDQIPSARMLLLLTFRPDFRPPWAMRSHLTHLTLGRLSRQQVVTMITAIAGGRDLPTEVVEQLVIKTEGVPLFVEELTKMVLESGLVKETAGRYELTGPLPPLAIPATLQDSLMARLDRLGPAKQIAQLGAMLGREFAYAVLQALAPVDEATLQHALAQLVDAELLHQRGLPPQARYIFKHALIQEAAYESILRSTRRQYHRQIAQLLEAQFPETGETQPELLAQHYTRAGVRHTAVAYWQRAGQRTLAHSAHVEAIGHLTQGLKLLETLPETLERTQQGLAMRLALGTALIATRGYAAPEVGRVFEQARALCQRGTQTPQLFPVLVGLWNFYLVRAELQTAHDLATQCFRLAEPTHDAALLLTAHFVLGATLFFLGEPAPAWSHLQQSLALYDPRQPEAYTFHTTVGHPTIACPSYAAFTLWLLGYPDQARRQSAETLALAQQMAHPFSTAYALNFAGWLQHLLRDGRKTQETATALGGLAMEHGFPFWEAQGTILLGAALCQQDHCEAGVASMRQGLTAYHATGAELLRPGFLAQLAEGYGRGGHPDDGLRALTQALELLEAHQERMLEAELYRLKGELLWQSGVFTPPPEAAEACFRQALEVARRQQARSLELRAAMSLSRLWQQQGERAAAHQLLAEVYGWFTEGFDTADLQAAKALLEELV